MSFKALAQIYFIKPVCACFVLKNFYKVYKVMNMLRQLEPRLAWVRTAWTCLKPSLRVLIPMYTIEASMRQGLSIIKPQENLINERA